MNIRMLIVIIQIKKNKISTIHFFVGFGDWYKACQQEEKLYLRNLQIWLIMKYIHRLSY